MIMLYYALSRFDNVILYTKRVFIHFLPYSYCGAVFADIQSSNVVGYQEYSLVGEEYMHNIGVQLQNMEAESFTITDNVFGAPLADYDMIYIFDADYFGYTAFTYMDLGDGDYGFSVMFADGSFGDPIYSITVNKGDNVLYMPGDAEAKPVVAGEVEKSGTKVVKFLQEENYIFPITNPFPQATKLKDLTCLQDYDMLYVWDSDYFGYTAYTYMDIGDGEYGFSVMFADGSFGDPIIDPEFVVLGVGQGGMFMPSDGDREWSVTMNY